MKNVLKLREMWQKMLQGEIERSTTAKRTKDFLNK